MKKNTKSGNQGMALLVATMFIGVALLTVGTLTMRVLNQKQVVDHYISFENCLYGLEAAINASQAGIINGAGGNIGIEVESGETEFPTFEELGDEAELPTVPGMENVEYYAFDQRWANDGIDNNGDGSIDGPDEALFHTLIAAARSDGIERQCEVVVRGDDVNCWHNAIFAGAGAAGGAIQGNCSIHGSVHILGQDIPDGGDAVVVMDLMGSSLIHNNYGTGPGPGPALPLSLDQRVPPLDLVTVNGEDDQRTLNAKVRIKNGLVSVNSNAEIGHAETAGNGVKDLVDGTYSNDGYTGLKTQHIYADNGTDEKYDLGDSITFPLLADDYRWPSFVRCDELGYSFDEEPGSTELASDGTPYSTEEFFETLSDDAVNPVGITIDTATDFYVNLTRGGTAATRVQRNAAACVKGDDYIYFNRTTNVMEFNGQIHLTGALIIKGKSNDDTIHYTGRGAILADGNVEISVNLVPCNNGVATDIVRSFPENNCIGIMTKENMSFGTQPGASQLKMCGGFYAEKQITSAKQTVVMGTFVSKFFNMGSQVPDIYQVPNLADNLPFGMIGAYPMIVLTSVYWREIPVS